MAEEAERKRMEHRALFAVLLACTVVPAVVFSGLIPVNGARMTEFYGISRERLGGTLMVAMAVFGPLGLAGGWLASRFGVVRVLAGSQVLLGAGLLLYAAYPGIGWPLVLVISCTMSGNALVGIGNKAAVELMPKKSGRGANLLHGVNALGKLAGPIIAGIFIGIWWRAGFAATGAMPLVLAVLVMALGRGYHRGEMSVGSGSARGVLKDWYFWAAVGGFGMIAGAEACSNFMLPQYLTGRGFSPAAAAY
ncbi:MAG TPA: MFS transporter, partial [Planctomycetes bacterium]|nr:MFS transporter [Planctomycetota bacterium]